MGVGCLSAKSSHKPIQIKPNQLLESQKDEHNNYHRKNSKEKSINITSKFVNCYTLRKENKEKDKSLEVILQRDLTENMPTNSKLAQNTTKSEGRFKELSNNLKKRDNEFEKKKGELTEEDLDLIRAAFFKHFLFSDLSEDIIDQILEQILLLEIKEGAILFKEGDFGNFFYINKNALLELTFKDQEDIKIFKEGDTFGELALIQRNKRSGTVICKKNGEVFCLEGVIFREIVQRMNSSFLKERMYFLSLIYIFKGLTQIQLQNLAVKMIKCEYQENFMIVKEGEKGDSLFIIKEGIVSCLKKDQERRKLYKKDYFGESSILFETRRNLSILSLSKTVCFIIVKAVLIEVLGENFKEALFSSLCKSAFLKSRFQELIFGDNFQKIYPLFKLKFYKNNEIVVENNHSKNRKLIVIIEGSLINSETKEIICDRGELYGDKNISTNEQLGFNVLSTSEFIGFVADWESVHKSLNLELFGKNVISFLSRVSQLRKIHIFKDFSNICLMEICKKMEKSKHEKGDIIIKENTPGEKLYFIFKGKVGVFKNGKLIRQMEEGNCFGENSLIFEENHSATIIANESLKLFSLKNQDFIDIADKKMIDYLKNKLMLQDNFSTQLEDLYFVKSLGEGKFGTVSLVHDTKTLYAIKAVSRKAADKRKLLIKYFQKERRIMLTLDHPFIIKLVKTLRGDQHIFYLMEYVDGMVLSKYIDDYHNEKNLRNLEETRFFVAILLVTIDYLNQKNIAHRDLKPDNIMISSYGYLKLIDFGTAIIIKNFTTTLTGTPNYIAPEVLLGKGYSFSSDYWSIGITAFELYFNYYPFGNDALDPMEVYKDILKRELKFPVLTPKDQNFCNFVSSLLKKKVPERVCNLEVLKDFPFFEDFNFNELVDMKIIPTFIPEVLQTREHYLNNTKTKYTNKLENIRKRKDSSGISSGNDDDNLNYDVNWADEF